MLNQDRLDRWFPLIPILLLALVMRIGYMPGLGYSPDMFNSTAWIKTIQQRGLLKFYADEPLRTYPPISIAAHALIGLVQQAAGLTLDPMKDAAYLALLKVPSVLAELALIAAVYGWLRRERWLRWLLPGMLAIYPGLIATSAWWGQNESIFTLFLVLALIALNRDRPLVAWLCFALALLSKQQSLVLAPLMLVLTLRRYGWRSTLLGIGTAGLLMLIVLAPFALASGVDNALSPYLGAADRFPDVSNNAYNLWHVMIPLGKISGVWPDGSPYTDALPILGPFTLKQAGLVLLGLYTLLITLNMWKRSGERREFIWAAALYCGIFMLPTQIHERYLYAGAVLIVIAIAQDRRLWWVALGILYTFSNNILQVAAPFTFLGLTLWHVDVSIQVALLNMVLLIELTRIILASVYGPSTLPAAWGIWPRMFIRLTTGLLVISLIMGLVADAMTKHATTQWLAEHIPDGARLGADGQAEEITILARQWPTAHTWNWQLPWNTDEKPVVQWQGEGVRYLLIDERTYEHESLSRRVLRLTDQGAVPIYETNNLLGMGTRQAVLSLEQK